MTQSPKTMEIAGSKRDPLGLLRRRHVGPRSEPISAELAGLLASTRNYQKRAIIQKQLTTRYDNEYNKIQMI